MAHNWRAIGVLTAVTTLGLGLVLPVGAVGSGPTVASSGTPALREINGLEPHRDPLGTKVVIQRGSAADSSGTHLITIAGSLTVDINQNGINGLDTGSPVDGQWYHLYLMYDAVEPQQPSGAVFSPSTTYGEVVYPDGYTHARKLPFAVYRQDDPVSPPGPDDGKFRPYRIFNWPALLVAKERATQPSSIESFLPLQTNSAREINYKWDSTGGCADIYVKGFYWNEPS